MPHLLASTIHCLVSAAPCAGRARARDAAQQVAAGEAEEVSGKQTLELPWVWGPGSPQHWGPFISPTLKCRHRKKHVL